MKKAIEVKGLTQLDKSKMVKINGGDTCGASSGRDTIVCTQSFTVKMEETSLVISVDHFIINK